jgi:hypothetical protein
MKKKKRCPICAVIRSELGIVHPINQIMCYDCFLFVVVGKHFDGKMIEGNITYEKCK